MYAVEFLEFEATKFPEIPMSFTTLYVIRLCKHYPLAECELQGLTGTFICNC